MIHNFDEPVNRRGTEAKKYAPEYYPQDVLPMWIADSDFKAPQPVVDALCERMASGVYGYPVVSEEYKGAFAYWQKTRFGWEVSASDVEFVPGVIPGIICAVRALSYPGDNVVINTPNYPPFKDLCDHNGRHLLRNERQVVDGQYAIDFEDLEAKLADVRTKVFILCNPQNPTGRVFTLEELKRIGELCIKHHVIVLSDEIHCDLVYKGHKHIPFGSISKEFADNSIVFMNASKTFNIAGFRSAAFIATNPRLHQAVHEAVLDNKGIGENLGVKINYVSTEAANRIEYLQTGKVDIILANFTVTPERAQEVDFALPYMNVALGVVSPDSRVITSLDDIGADDQVIVISGTTAETYLEKNNPEIKLQQYDAYAEANRNCPLTAAQDSGECRGGCC